MTLGSHNVDILNVPQTERGFHSSAKQNRS